MCVTSSSSLKGVIISVFVKRWTWHPWYWMWGWAFVCVCWCVYLIPSSFSWAVTEKRCEETNKLGTISKTMPQNEGGI